MSHTVTLSRSEGSAALGKEMLRGVYPECNEWAQHDSTVIHTLPRSMCSIALSRPLPERSGRQTVHRIHSTSIALEVRLRKEKQWHRRYAAIDTLTCFVTFLYTYRMEMKLELVAVPVSDVDRAKAFYTEKIGFHADHDYQVRDNLRFVQLTPPGSACSIVIGLGITDMQPGSVKGLQMVVADVQEIRDELVKRGVEVSDIEVMPWGSFVFFSDPDGNRWSLQQLPVRT